MEWLRSLSVRGSTDASQCFWTVLMNLVGAGRNFRSRLKHHDGTSIWVETRDGMFINNENCKDGSERKEER
jgi:hypothetical protein